MPNPYTDEAGVFTNKFGITDADQLKTIEYEATTNRARELIDGSIFIHEPDFGLARQQAIHQHLFQDVYEWAGKIRTVPSNKRMENGLQSRFLAPDIIISSWQELEKKITNFISNKEMKFEHKREMLTEIFIDANRIHPFPEGNGRSLQIFMKQLAQEQGLDLDFTKVTPREWNQASAVSGNHGRLFEYKHFIAQVPNLEPIKMIFADITYQTKSPRS